MNSITYKLKYPIQIGSELIADIKIKRPKGKHFRKMRALGKDMSFADVLDMIASLAGLAPSVIDEMDIEDVTALGELMNGFFSSERPSSS